MEAKDQGKRPKDWKVVAAVATASALGVSGLALADSDDGSQAPDAITLEDRTPITEVTVAKTTSTTLADLGVVVDTLDSASSPFDAPATTTTTIADSLASADPAPASVAPAHADDSPDPTPDPTPDSADSGADSVDDSAGS